MFLNWPFHRSQPWTYYRMDTGFQNGAYSFLCKLLNGAWQHQLWGGEKTDNNGQIIEEVLNDKNLVCVNDGRRTRIDIRTGKESVLDLTFISSRLAPKCEWEVYGLYGGSTIGSDHYPIMNSLDIEMTLQSENSN